MVLPNKPNLETYKNKRKLGHLKKGEVKFIIEQTGNHWRKIFSILAKICFHLNPITKSWQEYRDEILLTNKCISSISFSKVVHSSDDIVLLSGQKVWDNTSVQSQFVFKLPYFDYRQFPNKEIDRLNKNLLKIFR